MHMFVCEYDSVCLIVRSHKKWQKHKNMIHASFIKSLQFWFWAFRPKSKIIE
jgi:hypothetical protein